MIDKHKVAHNFEVKREEYIASTLTDQLANLLEKLEWVDTKYKHELLQHIPRFFQPNNSLFQLKETSRME